MIDCSTNTASPFNKNWSRVTLAWTFLHSSDTDKSRYDEIASTFSKSFLRATNQYSLWSIIDFWSLLKMKKYLSSEIYIFKVNIGITRTMYEVLTLLRFLYCWFRTNFTHCSGKCWSGIEWVRGTLTSHSSKFQKQSPEGVL